MVNLVQSAIDGFQGVQAIQGANQNQAIQRQASQDAQQQNALNRQATQQRMQIQRMEINNREQDELARDLAEATELALKTGQPLDPSLWERSEKLGMTHFHPDSYLDPERFKGFQEMKSTMFRVLQGDIAAINEPQSIEWINNNYPEIKKGIGEVHPLARQKIVDKRISRFDAMPEGHAVAIIESKLEDGSTYLAPRTANRSADPNAAVQLTPGGMLADDIMGRLLLQEQAQTDFFRQRMQPTRKLLDERLGRGQPEQVKFQQGTGDMSGYSFNPQTGEFSIDESVKSHLEGKAKNKAKERADLDAKDRRGINSDVTGLVKDAVLINNAAIDLAKLKETSSPMDQLAAVFKLMKALDPTSVVREGEQQQTRSTGGPADVLIGFANKLQGEGSLPPAAFSDMVSTARSLAEARIKSTRSAVSSYLNAYEDTIPESFKKQLLDRVPVTQKIQAKTENVSIDELVDKYAD